MKLPPWLKKTFPYNSETIHTEQTINDLQVNTVCLQAKCPNRLECYAKKTATFMALGDKCTRKCGFCNIAHDKSPPAPDPLEPLHIAKCAKKLGLKHIVITMVTRDDLKDQGSLQMAKIVQEVKKLCPSSTTEILTSDFSCNTNLLDIVLQEKPTVFNHNLETTKNLTPHIRYKAQYASSLSVLSYVKKSKQCKFVKSGLMIGLGETIQEIIQSLNDLSSCGCDIVTIGQYLQPSSKNIAVKKFYHPDEFEELKHYGQSLGLIMACGPFVRSSYNAQNLINN